MFYICLRIALISYQKTQYKDQIRKLKRFLCELINYPSQMKIQNDSIWNR